MGWSSDPVAVVVCYLHTVREERHANGVGLVGAEALDLFTLGEVEVLVAVIGVSELVVVHLVIAAFFSISFYLITSRDATCAMSKG